MSSGSVVVLSGNVDQALASPSKIQSGTILGVAIAPYERRRDAFNAEFLYSVLVAEQRGREPFMCHSLAPCQVKFVEAGQIFRDSLEE